DVLGDGRFVSRGHGAGIGELLPDAGAAHARLAAPALLGRPAFVMSSRSSPSEARRESSACTRWRRASVSETPTTRAASTPVSPAMRVKRKRALSGGESRATAPRIKAVRAPSESARRFDGTTGLPEAAGSFLIRPQTTR